MELQVSALPVAVDRLVHVRVAVCRQVERRATRRSIVATTMARMSAKSPKVVRKATANRLPQSQASSQVAAWVKQAGQLPGEQMRAGQCEVRSAWGRFGTFLVRRLSRASRVYLARAQLAVFHQTRTADVAARRNDGRGRLQRGNASLGRTLLPEYPDITLYIEHLRSRISNEPLEEVRCASPFFLRAWMSVVISEK